MIYYTIFSYLFMIGVNAGQENSIPLWNKILAPLVLPIVLGKLCSKLYDSIS
jgi:hypothetical protein